VALVDELHNQIDGLLALHVQAAKALHRQSPGPVIIDIRCH
jgi:hypothetical protein